LPTSAYRNNLASFSFDESQRYARNRGACERRKNPKAHYYSDSDLPSVPKVQAGALVELWRDTNRTKVLQRQTEPVKDGMRRIRCVSELKAYDLVAYKNLRENHDCSGHVAILLDSPVPQKKMRVPGLLSCLGADYWMWKVKIMDSSSCRKYKGSGSENNPGEVEGRSRNDKNNQEGLQTGYAYLWSRRSPNDDGLLEDLVAFNHSPKYSGGDTPTEDDLALFLENREVAAARLQTVFM
jgi:hypothetical protein